jgi:hypothetical protein
MPSVVAAVLIFEMRMPRPTRGSDSHTPAAPSARRALLVRESRRAEPDRGAAMSRLAKILGQTTASVSPNLRMKRVPMSGSRHPRAKAVGMMRIVTTEFPSEA